MLSCDVVTVEVPVYGRRTYDPSGRGVRARAVGRQCGKRTNSRLNAGGGEGCRESVRNSASVVAVRYGTDCNVLC